MSVSSTILVAAVTLLATISRLTTVLLLAISWRGLATVCSPAIPGRLSAHVLLLWDTAAWVSTPARVPCLGGALQAPGISMPRPTKMKGGNMHTLHANARLENEWIHGRKS